jgi:ATP-dependent Zn protease
MKQYLVSFTDIIKAESEEEAYEEMLKYLKDICKYEDLTAFEFSEEE